MMIVLLAIGITGLIKKQLTISKNKEISGATLKLFSIFFIIMAIERLLLGIDFWIFSLVIIASVIVMMYLARPAVSKP